MRDFDVERSFGLWRGDKWDYRLVRLHDDTGLSPYAMQYGQVNDQTGVFTVADCHRHDAARMDDSPIQWAHEWVTQLYEARRLLSYETTLRLYERLSEAAYGLLVHGDDLSAVDREGLLSLAHAVAQDLRARAGFDPRPDFPGLERMLIEWDRDTTGPDTTGLPVRGGSRMDAPMLGGA